MTTTAADPVFVDTNVLVYSTRRSPLTMQPLQVLWRPGGAGSTL
jgi:hypothetical protein